MRDPAFRDAQRAATYAHHVAPINQYVDALGERGRGWIPYVAPHHGGVHARVLVLLRDPGPMTDSSRNGSGFLCVENDDATAERLANLLDEAGIAARDTIPWNAYPWYINRRPNGAELREGIEVLVSLLDLLPLLEMVLLMGGDAQKAWRHARAISERARSLRCLSTYHSSNQAFIGDAATRTERLGHIQRSLGEIATALQGVTDNNPMVDIRKHAQEVVNAVSRFAWTKPNAVSKAAGGPKQFSRTIGIDMQPRYDEWLRSSSASTPHSDEMVIGFQLALELGMNPTKVVRVTRAQKGQSDRDRERVTAALAGHPEVRLRMDGAVRRLAWSER